MFEYQILHAPGIVSEQELNEIGKDRWELVSITSDQENPGFVYFFKRLSLPGNISASQISPGISIQQVAEAFRVNQK